MLRVPGAMGVALGVSISSRYIDHVSLIARLVRAPSRACITYNTNSVNTGSPRGFSLALTNCLVTTFHGLESSIQSGVHSLPPTMSSAGDHYA